MRADRSGITRNWAGRCLSVALATALLALAAVSAQAQQRPFTAAYTVKVASIEERNLHVTADFTNISQPSLDLSLPVWTPGWYTLENYAKNILRFEAKNANGKRLPLEMVRKQTWRIDTRGLAQVRVEFDYHADVLGLNQAKLTQDFAFFTGTQLFLEPVGHRKGSYTVRFEWPAGWKLLTSLTETSDPAVFTAPDYDTLVDSLTEAGNFDVATFEVDGKKHYFAATPAGAVTREKLDGLMPKIAAIVRAQRNMLGKLPYNKYCFFYFFMPAESNAMGGLEHGNSHVSIVQPEDSKEPERLLGLIAHEFYHLWNVKRIRPREMWPYDYSREQESPLLWVSEGFTNYFEEVSLYRAGLADEAQFLASVASAAAAIESNEARNYISVANASVSTWVGYDTPVPFSISYYPGGQNIGALLDLSILNDTNGTRGLGDVMRALYTDFYMKGRGFSTSDLLAVIKRVSGRDYNGFHRRHIADVEVPPYDTILGYAGYSLDRQTRTIPVFGVSLDYGNNQVAVLGVAPGSPAEAGGVRPGDVMVSVDGMDWNKPLTDEHRAKLSAKIGQMVKLVVRRAGEEKTLDVRVGSRVDTRYSVVPVASPNAAQLKVRKSWLKR